MLRLQPSGHERLRGNVERVPSLQGAHVRCHGWWSCSVSFAEADSEQPIDHQGKWQDGENGQEDRAAQEGREDLLLTQEKRASRNEESVAHAPQVPSDALPAGNSAACEHSDVASSGEQQDGAEEEAHAGWGSSFVDAAGVVEGV